MKETQAIAKYFQSLTLRNILESTIKMCSRHVYFIDLTSGLVSFVTKVFRTLNSHICLRRLFHFYLSI